MNRKTAAGLLIAAAALVLVFLIYEKAGVTSLPSPSRSESLLPSGHPEENAEEVYRFISRKMTGPYGIYTNLQDTPQTEETATGHEVLSESSSLMMRYAALAGQRELFETQWKLASATFNMKNGFSYRYSPKNGKKFPVNAAVDDLRIIRALYEAGEVFKEPHYTDEADKYGERFYNKNVNNGYMYDFYDENNKITNGFVTLCYINLGTLQNLSINRNSSHLLQLNMKNITDKGYLSDKFPFYETRFNYDTGKYSSENIHTVESLLTILNLAEVGAARSTSIDYIKRQVADGTLYGQYTREGVPTTDIRSTAIYAIAAMIGSEIGDDALYHRSIERMKEFRVVDTSSVLYGGFGDANSGQAYSFDNLMALLAYRY
ncbi:glycosyl hydrolase family 8 [Paenibacillus sp. BR2-3]|uniref:hypothetical protein n=1 Tax=Paenibacillus sp. BR2-3 TaxID=3048494 RepID=UPI0039775EA6